MITHEETDPCKGEKKKRRKERTDRSIGDKILNKIERGRVFLRLETNSTVSDDSLY